MRGFTLVELLVAIAVIATLMSLVLPTLGRARNMSRDAACQGEIRSIPQAVAGFERYPLPKVEAPGRMPLPELERLACPSEGGRKWAIDHGCSYSYVARTAAAPGDWQTLVAQDYLPWHKGRHLAFGDGSVERWQTEWKGRR